MCSRSIVAHSLRRTTSRPTAPHRHAIGVSVAIIVVETSSSTRCSRATISHLSTERPPTSNLYPPVAVVGYRWFYPNNQRSTAYIWKDGKFNDAALSTCTAGSSPLWPGLQPGSAGFHRSDHTREISRDCNSYFAGISISIYLQLTVMCRAVSPYRSTPSIRKGGKFNRSDQYSVPPRKEHRLILRREPSVNCNKAS